MKSDRKSQKTSVSDDSVWKLCKDVGDSTFAKLPEGLWGAFPVTSRLLLWLIGHASFVDMDTGCLVFKVTPRGARKRCVSCETMAAGIDARPDQVRRSLGEIADGLGLIEKQVAADRSGVVIWAKGALADAFHLGPLYRELSQRLVAEGVTESATTSPENCHNVTRNLPQRLAFLVTTCAPVSATTSTADETAQVVAEPPKEATEPKVQAPQSGAVSRTGTTDKPIKPSKPTKPLRATPAKKDGEGDPQVTLIREAYYAMLEEHLGFSPVKDYGREGRYIKQMLAHEKDNAERVIAILKVAFASADRYLEEQAFKVAVIWANWNTLTSAHNEGGQHGIRRGASKTARPAVATKSERVIPGAV